MFVRIEQQGTTHYLVGRHSDQEEEERMRVGYRWNDVSQSLSQVSSSAAPPMQQDSCFLSRLYCHEAPLFLRVQVCQACNRFVNDTRTQRCHDCWKIPPYSPLSEEEPYAYQSSISSTHSSPKKQREEELQLLSDMEKEIKKMY